MKDYFFFNIARVLTFHSFYTFTCNVQFSFIERVPIFDCTFEIPALRVNLKRVPVSNSLIQIDRASSGRRRFEILIMIPLSGVLSHRVSSCDSIHPTLEWRPGVSRALHRVCRARK